MHIINFKSYHILYIVHNYSTMEGTVVTHFTLNIVEWKPHPKLHDTYENYPTVNGSVGFIGKVRELCRKTIQW